MKDIDQAKTLPLPAENLIISKVNMNYDFKITIGSNLMIAFIWAFIYLMKYPTVRHSLLTLHIPSFPAFDKFQSHSNSVYWISYQFSMH